MSDDERERREQAERWREEIEAAKAGRQRPPASPREFTDPRRREQQPPAEKEDQHTNADDG
jgi:hypothetical protein